jgi:hypothetical protein
MPLMRSLRTLMLGVAQATFCAPAAVEAKTIPPEVMVPYAFDVQLPERTKDGRSIPERGDYRMENLLLALERRGMMPAHDGIAFQQILDIFKGLAWFIQQGDGAYITEDRLAEKVGCSAREIRRVLVWAKSVGWMPYWNRFRDVDRLKADDGRPATTARNNVYLLLALPRELAAQLAEEDVIDLMALGKKKPELGDSAAVDALAAAPDPSGSTATPRPPLAGDLESDTFIGIFCEERERHYGRGDHGKVRAENRATIASYVADLVGEACAWAPARGLELDRTCVRADLCRRIARTWLEWRGGKDILIERQHPVGLIVGDMAKLVGDALKAWKSAQSTPSARVPLPAAVAALPAHAEPEPGASTPSQADAPHAKHTPLPAAVVAAAAGDFGRHQRSVRGTAPKPWARAPDG